VLATRGEPVADPMPAPPPPPPAPTTATAEPDGTTPTAGRRSLIDRLRRR
jgi:hypothetical protein